MKEKRVSRQLVVRCVRSTDINIIKRATLTFFDQIPAPVFELLKIWALTGKGKFGKASKTVTINVIVTKDVEK